MLDQEEVDGAIAAFKEDLRNLTPVEVAQRRILHGDALALPGPSYHNLRAEVSRHFGLHPNNVLMVGSGKLGFSIAPEKRYRHFGERSDIDLAIAAPELFLRAWKAVHEFRDQGGYWEDLPTFRKYIFKGWIRPDKFPPAGVFAFANDWWEFFNELSASGRYSPFRISGALYMDLFFLERYQVQGVTACVDALHGGGE